MNFFHLWIFWFDIKSSYFDIVFCNLLNSAIIGKIVIIVHKHHWIIWIIYIHAYELTIFHDKTFLYVKKLDINKCAKNIHRQFTCHTIELSGVGLIIIIVMNHMQRTSPLRQYADNTIKKIYIFTRLMYHKSERWIKLSYSLHVITLLYFFNIKNQQKLLLRRNHPILVSFKNNSIIKRQINLKKNKFFVWLWERKKISRNKNKISLYHTIKPLFCIRNNNSDIVRKKPTLCRRRELF